MPTTNSTTAGAAPDLAALCADYWSTSIIDIHPGSIKVRGYPIQELPFLVILSKVQSMCRLLQEVL